MERVNGRTIPVALTVCLVLLTALLMPARSSAAETSADYIVVLKPGVNVLQFANEATSGVGVDVGFTYSATLRGFAATLTGSAHRRLQRDPAVAFIAEDETFFGRAQTLPTGVNRIDGDLSSVYTSGGSVNVPVAVLDSGIASVSDLNVQPVGAACSPDSLGWSDLHGHGTHVAGIIGARNNTDGVVGVAPGAPLYSVRVLDSALTASTASVLCGIEWVATVGAALGVKVANMSFGNASGAYEDDHNCGLTNNDPVHIAICSATNSGVLFVSAAGNDGVSTVYDRPSSYDEVLAVTWMNDYNGTTSHTNTVPSGCSGLGPDDSYAVPSNFARIGHDDEDHTMAAPGSCITSTSRTGGTTVMSGSSQAAPHVAGTAALCLSTGACSGTPANVLQQIRTTAAGRPSTYGFVGDPHNPRPGLLTYYGYLVHAGGY